MTGKESLRFRRGDAIAIAAVILAALGMLAFFLLSAGNPSLAVVRIYQEGKLIRELPLSGDSVFAVEGPYHNTVTIREGKAAITESDCPGEDCVHSGWISRPGRSIVCLPNRVEIRVEAAAASDDDVDAVVR